MPPLNTSGVAYSMAEEVQNYMILELRKFFGGQPPYSWVCPQGLIPTDFVYAESSPGVPIGALNIVDEENFDDRRIPSIILTGFNGDTVELGFGQAGMRSDKTREPNPVMSAPVVCATVLAGNIATAFANGSVVDGVTLATGNRILIKNQVNPAANGVYVVPASGAPARSSDFNTAVQFNQWSTFLVQGGITNGGRSFSQTTIPPTTLGTSPIQYEDRGLGILEWDDRVGARNINITYSIRARTTSQRVRLSDLLLMAIQDRRLVRGEIEKQDVFITLPFLRETGSSEDFTASPGTDMIYRVDYSSTFFTQWSHRLLKTESVAKSITPEPTEM